MKVVNIKKEHCDIYIGRGSMFGNPFRITKNHNRALVIALYRGWFYNQLKDVNFKEEVKKLRGQSLGCYCKPLPCHGDIIVEYLENVEVQNE